MKKVLFILGAFFYTINCVNAQDMLWFGTKASYPYPSSFKNDMPSGYTPFFINHVGRHGSRYMTKPGADSSLFKIFNIAAKQNGLTELGKKWQKLNAWLLNIQQGKYAEITKLGFEEHRGIANRMKQNYSAVFTTQGKYDVWITSKLRTKQSANGFLSGLNENKKSYSWYQQPEKSETMLRFYDYSPIYDAFVDSSLQKMKKDSVATLVNIKSVYESVAEKLFTAKTLTYLSTQTIKSKNKNIQITPELITNSLYDVYGVGLSSIIEFKNSSLKTIGWKSPFSDMESAALGKVEGVEDFMVKGPGMDLDGIQAKIAAPLLVNFINTTDSIVNSQKQVNAIFRFTHAEAIAPMATLMELSNSDHPTTKIDTYFEDWKAANVIPMAANIQWVFVKNDQGGILVKVLLNEIPQHLPISAQESYYYNWNEVRSYYVAKLKKYGVNLYSDMLQYLKGVK